MLCGIATRYEGVRFKSPYTIPKAVVCFYLKNLHESILPSYLTINTAA